jgi:chromosome partitioning protein
VNLAAMLALSGRRTLLMDLDPKGDATAGVGLPRASGAGDLQALADPTRLVDALRAAPRFEGLDVWPGGPALEGLEALIWARGPEGRDRLLRSGLIEARRRYRAILIDSPTGAGPIRRNALTAADVLIVPLAGDRFSLNAVEETLASVDRVRPPELPPVEIFGLRIGVRREEFLLGKAPEMPGEGHGHRRVLETAIAYDARTLAEASSRGLPVFEQALGGRVTRSYVELAREVIARIVDTPRAFPTDSSPALMTPPEGTKIEPSGP